MNALSSSYGTGHHRTGVSEADVNSRDDEVVHDIDLDDSVNHLQNGITLNWGAKLDRPNGAVWKERVCYEWRGVTQGRLLHVVMDRSTGTISKVSRFHFIPIGYESIDVQSKFTVGIFSIGLTGNGIQLFRRTSGRTVESTQLLRSSTPSKLARMALAAVEIQGLMFGSNSACYLPRSPDGKGPRHTASIPSTVFSGSDAYYRERDNAVFLLTETRSLRLLPGHGSCRYHVREEEFDKHERGVMLASLELQKGTVG